MTTNSHYIAGWKTLHDWDSFKNELVIDGTHDKWEKAYSDYLIPRLNLRYFNPVKILQEHGTFQGEGFSIMTILCSLVEFLESTYQGKIYKYVQRGQQLGQNEYSSSKTMFISFLENRAPFKTEFVNGLATEFYSSIRCGLLHEATTKNGWRIWAKSPNGKIVNQTEKIIYRDDFEKAINKCIEDYGQKLQSSADLQRSFIIKFDDLKN